MADLKHLARLIFHETLAAVDIPAVMERKVRVEGAMLHCGDVKVDVITIWPGHATEEVERLITIPLEKELNGIAGITFLKSES